MDTVVNKKGWTKDTCNNMQRVINNHGITHAIERLSDESGVPFIRLCRTIMNKQSDIHENVTIRLHTLTNHHPEHDWQSIMDITSFDLDQVPENTPIETIQQIKKSDVVVNTPIIEPHEQDIDFMMHIDEIPEDDANDDSYLQELLNFLKS
jgi:hypothetical protein